jgi:hypothetical protein
MGTIKKVSGIRYQEPGKTKKRPFWVYLIDVYWYSVENYQGFMDK